MRYAPFGLAVPATGAAVFLSILSGMQRGGLPSERVAWVMIGVLLTAAAHLLPALWSGASLPHRIIAAGIWMGCMAATCYGHAVFFLLAQQHAGEHRAQAVTGPHDVGRDLGAIATDRATAVAQLVARCASRCEAKHVTLRARIDALDAEADDARRRETAADRAVTRRDELRADPVTGRLASALGVPESRLDLLVGMLCALTLEGVGCLCWALALDRPAGAAKVVPQAPCEREVPPAVTVAEPAVTETVASNGPPDAGDRERVAAEIAAGRLRCTVADIRRFLSCSQQRAMLLRRELESMAFA
ncbi:MAG: hypothetical protein EPN70_00725 [Paraburkholderia sp.]|uniref:hypothetical protein n=1 Tax=Paraburkholderia sp. TaxID=1926495 RepID=UPI00120196CC|nr:hypothetical protein [Paraburkholderia sp.]TAM08298.1 MAG: hypothetical protein EPN70_00725 [Paraburkholderia sp.]TAM28048.1 MAG: hypothetical protein EPN59_17920 [Paraburkholderia sp.]